MHVWVRFDVNMEIIYINLSKDVLPHMSTAFIRRKPFIVNMNILTNPQREVKLEDTVLPQSIKPKKSLKRVFPYKT